MHKKNDLRVLLLQKIMYAEDVQSFVYWILKQTLHEVYLAGRVVGRWAHISDSVICWGDWK